MENSKQPIHPTNVTNPVGDWVECNGLTKREYFAGLAMQGIIASFAGLTQDPVPESVAKSSVKFADELLKQLEQ